MDAKQLDIAPPRAKQRDAVRTRDAILRAAIRAFAASGYGGVGVREIAAAANVNSALVGRYFGSKEALFDAAFAEALDMAPLLEAERSQFGLTVARVFLAARDVPSPMAMMILSAGDPVARDICARRMQSEVIDPLAAWLGSADGQDRAIRLNMLWMGFLTAWSLVALPPLQDGEALGRASRWLADATQAIVDETAC